MSALELLAKATAKTPSYEAYTGGQGDIGWQDVLEALHGVSIEKTAFALFIITGDTTCRHHFWAGLFMESCQLQGIQRWTAARRATHPKALADLCQLVVAEWERPGKHTQESRAHWLGLSRGTWDRRYRSVYTEIYAITRRWKDELEEIIKIQLR